MEERVKKLEELADATRSELRAIDVRLTRIEATIVTKADLQESLNAMIKWVVGTAVGLGIAAITVMTFVLNNAVPKPPANPATSPIVITLPAPTTGR
jgi:hypothetical protein